MSIQLKPITTHFFKVDSDESIVNRFEKAYKTLVQLRKGTDFFSISQNKYLIKFFQNEQLLNSSMLFWSAVRERNTWQVRSQNDGTLKGLQDANSIVGDPSYYLFDYKKKILAAFTTYSSTGYLKAMSNAIFKRLLPPSAKFTIDYLTDNQIITQIQKWDYFSKLSIKLNTMNIPDNEEKPELIRTLLSIKDTFGSSTISISLDGGDEKLPKQDVTETINYLSLSENCASLNIAGGMFDAEKRELPVDIKRAFIRYHVNLELRPNQKYIRTEEAMKILIDAYQNTKFPESIQ